MKIENHPAFAEKLPRICYVLGGEKTPLKIGEEFQMRGYDSDQYFCIQPDGKLYITLCKDGPAHVASDSLCDAINHPEKIIRRPQFSEDEEAFLRLLVKSGFPWLARDDDGDFWGFENEPHNYDGDYDATGKNSPLPGELLTQITFENSPFDAAAYLESEATK